MKNTSKIILLLAIIGGLCWLFARFVLGIGGAKTARDPEQINNVGELRELIDEYADKISNGWSDEAYEAALIAVNRNSSEISSAELAEMNDRVATSFLSKVAEFIKNSYTPQMVNTSVSGNSSLAAAYRGLDRLASEYELVAHSPLYTEMTSRRELHDDIYNFGRKSYEQTANMKPTIEWFGPNPELSYNELFNYAPLRQREFRQCKALAGLAAANGMMGVNWIAAALNESNVSKRLAEGEEIYNIAENSSIKNFLALLPGSVCREPATRSGLLNLVNSLRSMQDDTRSMANRAGIDAAFDNCRSQIAEKARNFPQ
ncbi:MAG: hypothetical protein K2L28_05045 [Muribaculaceae bacterium]|nr:hypothetical protein [Muribaculaceae bacterium]